MGAAPILRQTRAADPALKRDIIGKGLLRKQQALVA